MPEEITGGKGPAENPAAAPSPGAGEQPAVPADTTPAGAEVRPEGGDADREAFIPRNRFDAVNTRMQSAERRAGTYEGTIQQQQQIIQGLIQRIQAAQAPAAATPEAPADDPEAKLVRSRFSTDDTGNEIFEAVNDVSDFNARRRAGETEKKLADKIQHLEAQLAGITGTFQTGGRIQNMMKQGMLSPQDGQTLTQHVARHLSAHPEWQGHQDLLVSHFYTAMREKGQIQAPAAPQPEGPSNMIVTPGGTRNVRPAEDAERKASQARDADMETLRSRFRSLGRAPREALNALYIAPSKATRQVPTDDGVATVPADVLSAAFTHKRG